ncbi:hypothetical protein D918_05838 [Trichuris suis]|nr:hypothetical protein D918_05838 [Trichuris suis]
MKHEQLLAALEYCSCPYCKSIKQPKICWGSFLFPSRSKNAKAILIIQSSITVISEIRRVKELLAKKRWSRMRACCRDDGTSSMHPYCCAIVC